MQDLTISDLPTGGITHAEPRTVALSFSLGAASSLLGAVGTVALAQGVL